MVLSSLNPNDSLVDFLRTFNTIGSIFACLLLIVFKILPNWNLWTTPRRLKTMSLFFFCFTSAYGTFEIQHLTTSFRVPMISLSIIWAVVASAWPSELRNPNLPDFLRRKQEKNVGR